MIETYELAVIGAGPAGMEAAVTAAGAGVKTVLVDQYARAGGQYDMALPDAFTPGAGTAVEKEGRQLQEKLNRLPLAAIYNTLVWGLFKEAQEVDWLVGLYGADAPKFVRARTLILASGAYDTPVAFPGWTLPGVITCGAALILLKNQRIMPGMRVLVTGTGPLLLSAAAHLIEAGAQVVCVCEANRVLPRGLRYAMTMLGQPHRLMEGAKYMRRLVGAGTPYKTGWSIKAARGKERVEEAVITPVDARGRPVEGSEQSFKVDLVVSGYSLTPNTGLARMVGCQMQYRADKGGWVAERDDTLQTSQPGVYMVGDGAGIGGAENSRLEGRIAGVSVAAACGHLSAEQAAQAVKSLKPHLENQRRFGVLLGDLFSPLPELIALADDETIVCRCEEITLGEVKAAVAQGARTMGEVKMITRTGMGNCQGRMCEHSVSAAIVQALAAEKMTRQQVGYYAVRPPLHPIPLNALANAATESI